MNSELVTVATFSYPTEIVVYESKLENQGIQCFKDGENHVTVDPFISNAIG